MEAIKKPKLKRKKTPVPKVMDYKAIDVLFGKHDDPKSRMIREYTELESFIKILKTLMRNNQEQYKLRNLCMPSSLLIQDNVITMITASPEGSIEFLKNPEDKVLITRYGNLTNPTDNILVMKTIIPVNENFDSDVPNYKVEFKLINTFEITELIKQVRSNKKHPVILIQKLLLNFQTGGKRLSVFHNRNNPLAIEVTNKFHPNF